MAEIKSIKVLGPGCPNCTALYQNAQAAVQELNAGCTIDKVSDINEIMNFGVMMTPALVIDGEVKVMGKVPSVGEIKQLLM
jgi:small redox-active disulfide protein 2